MRLVEHFVAETAALFYRKVREVIARRMLEELPFSEEVEVDASYCGGARQGKRGRGAGGKVPVLGILKRSGKVCAIPIEGIRSATWMPIPRQKAVPDSIVYTDGLRSYKALDVGECKQEPRKELVSSPDRSMASRTSGTRPEVSCVSTTASPSTTSGVWVSFELRHSQSTAQNPPTLAQKGGGAPALSSTAPI